MNRERNKGDCVEQTKVDTAKKEDSMTKLAFNLFLYLGLLAIVISVVMWLISPLLSFLPETFLVIVAAVYWGNQLSGKSE